MAKIFGTSGPNLMNGTAAANNMDGLGGNDTINGFAGNDTLSGGAGNDLIKGGAGVDYLYGNAGSDTFVFAAADGDGWTEQFGGETIMDFQGQAKWSATNNDFIAFTGFGAGAHLDYVGGSVHNAQLQYYVVQNAANVTVFHLAVKMEAGAGKLSAGDYAFYA